MCEREPKHSSGSRQQEGGFYFVLVSLLLLVIFGFAAFAIDVSKNLNAQRHINLAGDAAALAASRLLGSTATMVPLKQEACTIAAANGLTNSEVVSVQCGTWSAPNFTPKCSSDCISSTTCTTCSSAADNVNAVRVVTRRGVSTSFARVMGVQTMYTTRDSVAKATFIGDNCIRPFALEECTVSGITPGNTASSNFWVGESGAGHIVAPLCSQSPWTDGGGGNWGKLMFPGIQTPQDWQNVMEGNGSYGANGYCDSSIQIGSIVQMDTGNARIQQTFDAGLAGSQFFLALTAPFPSGNHTSTISNFARVQFLQTGAGCNGSNWCGQFRLLEYPATPPMSGPPTTFQSRKLAR